MSYVDVDNFSFIQTKLQNWKAVSNGKLWNPSNVDIIEKENKMPFYPPDDVGKSKLKKVKRYLRVCRLRFKRWIGFKLTTQENSEIAYWITRNVTTPPGLNAHDVCEIEWEKY